VLNAWRSRTAATGPRNASLIPLPGRKSNGIGYNHLLPHATPRLPQM
jgi:hypothetical protein